MTTNRSVQAIPMTELRTCPTCRTSFTANAALGMCPRCLLQSGFSAAAESSATSDWGTQETCDGDPHSPGRADLTHGGAFGEYELIEEVARGGMGVIYKARQMRLNRTVAIKMIRGGQFASEQEVERFMKEAEAAARLDHPGIVPIYEVGQQGTQHFYSMAFVEGPSLAERLQDGPLPPTVAAHLTKKLAIAIGYAHGQGVIHRDLKPANILLAPDVRESPTSVRSIPDIGEPRVTDFGVAKNSQDRSGLTQTGQVLGTPSYMPPEQARGGGEAVSKVSDVYALGAILYACLTGRPPFQAASPLDTLKQVLEQDPVEPRQLNARIPRDLETICLKCLEKDPARRYSGAQELAEDLQRFLDDKPIHARPLSPLDRGSRWLRNQGGNVALGSLAAIATGAFVLLIAASWLSYSHWSLGQLSLDTDDAPLVAEFLDRAGQRVAEPETIPTASPVSLPASEYVLRVSGEGRLSQNYRAHLERDEHAHVKLNLDDQLFWAPLEVSRQFDLAPLDGRMNVLHMTEQGLARFDGTQRWQLSLSDAKHKLLKAVKGFVWPWPEGLTQGAGHGKYDLRPRCTAVGDVDGDGADDFVMAARHQAWLLAVSGASGEVLWVVARGADTQRPPARSAYRPLHSAVVGPPKLAGDLDGDERSDVILMFADIDKSFTQANFWVEAISTASGKTLWKYDLPEPTWTNVRGGVVPYHFRLFTGAASGAMGGASGSNTNGRELTRGGSNRGETERFGSFVYAPDEVQLCQTGDRRLAVFATGGVVTSLDVTNGQPVSPPQGLPLRPSRSAVVADVDGEGTAELIFVGEQGKTPGAVSLCVWSIQQQAVLWEKRLEADYWMRPNFRTPRPAWPLAADLDGDGCDEILVPDGSSAYTQRWPRTGWGGLHVLHGATGASQWTRPFRTMDEQVDWFVPGPDVDADGVRDLFVATLLYRKAELYVDCVSGKDGRQVWMKRHKLSDDLEGEFWIGQLQWWQGDGWPRLIVPVIPDPSQSKVTPSLYVLRADSGDLDGIGRGIDDVRVADLDGDRVEELVTFRADGSFEGGGTLYAMGRSSSQRWRRLGEAGWRTAGDLDQDGFPDVVQTTDGGYVQAISGQSGQPLWRQARPATGTRPELVALETDVNGDAVPDLLTAPGGTSGGSRTSTPFHALSGRDGRKLWTAPIHCKTVHPVAWVKSHDLDRDGAPEILLMNKLDWKSPQKQSNSSKDGQLWLVNLHGRSGAIRWEHALSGFDSSGARRDTVFEPYLERDWSRVSLGDLNDDGVLDVLVPAEDPDAVSAYQLRAIDGRDGKTLWGHRLPLARESGREMLHTTTCVADVDGTPGVEVLLLEMSPDRATEDIRENTIVRLKLLDRTTGTMKWQWETKAHGFNATGRGPADNVHQRNLRPSVRLVRRAGSLPPLLCLNLWETRAGIVLLDTRGNELRRLSVPGEARLGVWPLDVDRDGDDELIVWTPEAVMARETTGAGNPLWQLPFEPSPDNGLVHVVSAEPGLSPRVVLRVGSALLELDASSGQVIRRCAGPRQARDEEDDLDSIALLRKAQRPTLAGSVTSQGDITYGTHAVTADGSQPLRGQVAARDVPAHDPRLLRDLPWMSELVTLLDAPMNAAVRLGWQALLSTFLIVVPGIYLSYLVGRRRWSLSVFLLLPVVLGVVIFALSMPAPDYRWVAEERLALALAMLPAVVLPASCLVWAFRKEWRRLATWTVATLLLSVALGVSILALDVTTAGLSFRYSWKGWYTILLYGAYWIGWAMVGLRCRAWAATVFRCWMGSAESDPQDEHGLAHPIT